MQINVCEGTANLIFVILFLVPVVGLTAEKEGRREFRLAAGLRLLSG